MQAFLKWAQLVAVLGLTGCAAMQPTEPASDLATHQHHLANLADINQFNIQGRIGVQT